MPALKKKSNAQRSKQSKLIKQTSRRVQNSSVHQGPTTLDGKDPNVTSQCSKNDKAKRLSDTQQGRDYCTRLSLAQRKRLSIDEKRAELKARLCSKNDKASIRKYKKSISEKNRLQDSKVRIDHNIRNSICQTRRLEDEAQRKKHCTRISAAQKKRLSDAGKRTEHCIRISSNQKKRLSDTQKRRDHCTRMSLAQRKRLSIDEKRAQHRARLSFAQRKRLSIEERRSEHRAQLSLSQKKRLNTFEERAKHCARLSAAQEKRLRIFENRLVHRKRALLAQRQRLKDPIILDRNRQMASVSQKRRLNVPTNKLIHRQRLIAAQKKRLSNNEKRKEHLKQLKLRNNTKLGKLIKNKENALAGIVRIMNPQWHSNHRKRMAALEYVRCIRLQRLSRLQLQNRNENNRVRRINYERRVEKQKDNKQEKMFNQYKNDIKLGMDKICASCARLFFPNCVTYCTVAMICENKIKNKNITLEFIRECCPNMESDINVGYLCGACKRSLKNNEIPRFSMFHKELAFPDVPSDVKSLSALEERFICPRIPFMKIFCSIGQQMKVSGRSVNVPADPAQNIEILPRLPHETDTVVIAFKRRTSYKSNIMIEPVRPWMIARALKALDGCPAFTECGITVDYDRICELAPALSCDSDNSNGSDNENDISEEEEEEDPINIPAEETMLYSDAIAFAPGQNFSPLPLLIDTHAESLSYLTIYGGQLKRYAKHLSYQETVKHEIMQSDRRVASNVEKLFFSTSFLRAQKISSSIALCLRKHRIQNTSISVGDVMSNNFISQLVNVDSAYRQFTVDRCSPAYWEQKKKEVFAFIRQEGPPTLFLTMSPAETRWRPLMRMLKKLVDGVVLSESEADALPYVEKARLIRSDPVAVACYFNYRMKKMFQLLKQKNSVFREYNIKDLYYRVEFQQRGSPHVHCLIWLDGAPIYKEDDASSKEKCIQFIDRFITCETGDFDSNLLKLQTHGHTFTCYKRRANGVKKCRFNIPVFPMNCTMILEPLENPNSIELKKLQNKADEIKTYLTESHDGNEMVNISHSQFLNKIGLTQEQYVNVVRSTLKRPQVFLKRSLQEVCINAYNKDILKLHQGNMDIQFILDVYSCANYVLNYINKSNAGMSKILRDAMDEVRRGNFTLREKLRFLANKFLNASEFSAQEAVYYLLSFPLSVSSRSTIFISTGPPDKRILMLKSNNELSKLSPNSTDIYKANIIDHYCNRPDELENICLAEFAAFYQYNSRSISASRAALMVNVRENNDSDNSQDEDDISLGNAIKMKNGKGVVKKRGRAKIIRYVKYIFEQDEENYYRENVLLFVPFRNEQCDIINKNVKELYTQHRDLIYQNHKKFNHSSSEKIYEVLSEMRENDSDSDSIADHVQHLQEDEDRLFEPDIFFDMGIGNNNSTSTNVETNTFPIPQFLADNEYNEVMRSLNEKQRKYVMHVLHLLKTNSEPIYECVIGSAGCGKSRLITAIQQSLLRFYKGSRRCTSVDAIKVLLCGPTGKCSYNIRGITCHSAFALPVNQLGGNMPALSSSVSNSLLSKLLDLQIILIDETSMVGSKMLSHINTRLQQIFRSKELFAGKSIILLGDFNQLAPVGDRMIYEPDSTCTYGDLIGNPLWEKFKLYRLTEIMRQRDDFRFAQALTHLALGNMSDDEINMFRERQHFNAPSDAIRLFRTNAEVDAYNDSIIRKQEKVLQVKAIDSVVGNVSKSVKQSLINSVSDMKTSATYGLPKNLKISLGIHYMLTNNIKVIDGLVNGAIGILKYIETNQNGEVTRLWLMFDDVYVGKQLREEVYPYVLKKSIDFRYTPIEMVTRNIRPRKNSTGIVLRKQFPLVPAEAMTIYKSQGATYKSVVVHLRKGMRRNEMYVAFSRATSLTGLFIKGTGFQPPTTGSNRIQQVISDVENKRPVQLSLLYLQEYSNQFTVAFHNIQSLRKHIDDLRNDPCLTSASVLALVESWLYENEVLHIDGYKIVYRVDVDKQKSHAYGLIVYVKTNISQDVEILFHSNSELSSNCHNIVTLRISDINICFVYKSPTTPLSTVKDELEAMLDCGLEKGGQVLVMGDFNIDILNVQSSSPFTNILSQRKLINLICNKPSTDNGTQIDVCFSNIINCKACYFESYFSYHKPILFVLKETNHYPQDDLEHGRELSLDQEGGITDNHNLISENALQWKNIESQPVSDEVCVSTSKELVSIVENTSTNESIPATGKHQGNGSTCNSKRILTNKSTFEANDIAKKSLNQVKGFVNSDGVSCYCNVICQTIINVTVLRLSVMNALSNNPLKSLCQNYRSTSERYLCTQNVRKFVDDTTERNIFKLQEQQDVVEFFESLASILTELKDAVSYSVREEQYCSDVSCPYRQLKESYNVMVLTLTLHENARNLNDLVRLKLNEITDYEIQCPECNSQIRNSKNIYEIPDANKALVITLNIFQQYSEGIGKKKLNITNFHSEIVYIGDIRYRVDSIISHHGELITSGHYTCQIRMENNEWYNINDKYVTQPNNVKCKNAYVLFLTRLTP